MTIPSPWDPEIAHYEELVAQANARGTQGRIWDNQHRLALALAEGYRRAKAEDAPLLEAAKAATAILNIPDDGRFHATEEALLILRTAIAQAEGREQPASQHP